MRAIKTAYISLVMLPFAAIILLSFCSLFRQSVPAEHSQLIEDFRNGRVVSLDAIHPRPTRIWKRNELHNPSTDTAYVLEFDFEDNSRLVIVLNDQLRLVGYSVEKQD